jgi:hypothetical protein
MERMRLASSTSSAAPDASIRSDTIKNIAKGPAQEYFKFMER